MGCSWRSLGPQAMRLKFRTRPRSAAVPAGTSPNPRFKDGILGARSRSSGGCVTDHHDAAGSWRKLRAAGAGTDKRVARIAAERRTQAESRRTGIRNRGHRLCHPVIDQVVAESIPAGTQRSSGLARAALIDRYSRAYAMRKRPSEARRVMLVFPTAAAVPQSP